MGYEYSYKCLSSFTICSSSTKITSIIKAETELQSTPCSTAQSVTWEPQNEDPTRAEASRQLLITYTWDSIYIYYIIYICSLHDQWSYW